MKQIGRPSIYSQELADKIIGRMSDGESLRKICEDEGMPNIATIMRWKLDNQHFCAQYDHARTTQAHRLFEELIAIADDKTGDTQRDRLRVDTRKWFLSKVAPKIYGDKLDITSDNKVLPTPIINLSNAVRANNSD